MVEAHREQQSDFPAIVVWYLAQGTANTANADLLVSYQARRRLVEVKVSRETPPRNLLEMHGNTSTPGQPYGQTLRSKASHTSSTIRSEPIPVTVPTSRTQDRSSCSL